MEFYVTSTGIVNNDSLIDGIERYKYYDPSKYDLVEKKDYKSKKLKEDLDWYSKQKNTTYKCIKYHEEYLQEASKTIEALNVEIERLELELKELEK